MGIEQLFRVACGLESMVVGEDQILSQVKQAWEIAKKCKSTGKYTNKLFREAVTLGKNAASRYLSSPIPIRNLLCVDRTYR